MATKPLTVSRVPTIYSLAQLEETATFPPPSPFPSPPKGVISTPDRAVAELAGSLLPAFHYADVDALDGGRVRSFGSFDSLTAALGPPGGEEAIGASPPSSEAASDEDAAMTEPMVVPQRSVLSMLLLAEWEDRAERGLFRYDVTACPTRVLPGHLGFVAQCNEGRASKKRPTEFRVDQVTQAFDPAKFNFTKAAQKEVLFAFEAGRRGGGRAAPRYLPSAPARASPHLVFINVSPIEYGHVLLVPDALSRRAQAVDTASLLLALQFAREADTPYLRLGFNSLGAYGTINHLHFQAYFLYAPLAAERAPAAELLRAGGALAGVSVASLEGYPVAGLVFQAGGSLADLARCVGAACEALAAAGVPHNLLIADCGVRVFLFPNAFAERKARGEIPEGGHHWRWWWVGCRTAVF